MVGASRVAVNAEGLAHVNVFAHLDLDILGIPVEKMQDGHERHGGVNVVFVIAVYNGFELKFLRTAGRRP